MIRGGDVTRTIREGGVTRKISSHADDPGSRGRSRKGLAGNHGVSRALVALVAVGQAAAAAHPAAREEEMEAVKQRAAAAAAHPAARGEEMEEVKQRAGSSSSTPCREGGGGGGSGQTAAKTAVMQRSKSGKKAVKSGQKAVKSGPNGQI
jgi:hypothetical protein